MKILLIFVFGLVVLVLLIFVWRFDSAFVFNRILKDRLPMDDGAFFQTYYKSENIDRETCCTIRTAFGDFVGVDPQMLRPEDEPTVAFDTDSVELVLQIEQRFEIQIPDDQCETLRSIDSVIRFVSNMRT